MSAMLDARAHGAKGERTVTCYIGEVMSGVVEMMPTFGDAIATKKKIPTFGNDDDSRGQSRAD